MVNSIRQCFSELIWFSKKSTWFWIAGLALFIATGLINIGIIAMDDYACMISKIIPAQNISFHQVVAERDIRSPFAPMVLLVLSKTGLKLGIQDPTNQLRFVLCLLAVFSFLCFSLVGSFLFKESPKKREWLLFLCGFYFLCPLFLSRPMIESISAPLLLLSCFWATRYWSSDGRFNLALSLGFVVLAALIRFQSGICYLGLLAMVLIKRKPKDIVFFCSISLAAFLITGLFDKSLTGQFHGSLFNYVDYNLKYSSTFGTSPFYTFLLLLLALTLPPTLFCRYRNFDWKKEYNQLLPVVLYFVVFVVAHSWVPHKEERFLVPVIPFFLICLVPLLNFQSKDNSRSWRVRGFVGLNLILLPLTCFNLPQNNSIGMVRFVGRHPEVRTLVSIADTLVLYPEAYSLRSPELIKISVEDAEQLRGLECDVVVVVRADYEEKLKRFTNFHEKIREFKPGPLEQILIKLNRRLNLRRGPISLYADPKCVTKF